MGDVAGGAGQRHVDGVGVAARARIGLEHGDVAMGSETVSGAKPGDAGADDRDAGAAHAAAPAWRTGPCATRRRSVGRGA